MTHRGYRPRSLGFALLLASLAPLSAARAAGSAPPALDVPFRADSTRITASPEATWALALSVQNPSAGGLYLDSLTCSVEDLDPGETRAERVSLLELTPLLSQFATLSAGDSTTIQYSAPAIAEHARLTFHLTTHHADRTITRVATVVEAMPGPLSLEHPSQFLEVAGRRVEFVLFPAVRDSGLAPGLLLVHGHANHARRQLRVAQILAARGYTVMMVSQPGYGQSEGPADFMGPATVRAASAALDRLEKTPGVDPRRVGLWGVSRGATVVTLLAQQRADVAAVVSQSGVYDPWAAYRGTQIPGIRENMVREIGSDSSAWRERAPALEPGKPAAAFLILHGERDRNVPFAQAQAFAAMLQARGAAVETRFFPDAEHMLPRGEVQRAVLDFLKPRLRP